MNMEQQLKNLGFTVKINRRLSPATLWKLDRSKAAVQLGPSFTEERLPDLLRAIQQHEDKSPRSELSHLNSNFCNGPVWSRQLPT